jgi:hypothetical protein
MRIALSIIASSAPGRAKARLDDGAQQLLMIEHLMGVGFRFRSIDAAGQEDQRHPVLPGVGNDIDRIGDARPERCQKNARRRRSCFTRLGMPHALGHEAAGILVLDEMKGDPGALQRIHQRQHLAAGNAEGMAAAGLAKLRRDQSRTRVPESIVMACRLPARRRRRPPSGVPDRRPEVQAPLSAPRACPRRVPAARGDSSPAFSTGSADCR